MNRGERVLAGVAGLVVVGLLALSAPVIASWVTGSDAAERPSAATTSTHAPAPTDTPLPTSAATATADPGDGEYQSVGDGLVIPAQGSGGCSTWAAIHPYGDHDPSARSPTSDREASPPAPSASTTTVRSPRTRSPPATRATASAIACASTTSPSSPTTASSLRRTRSSPEMS